MTEPPRRMSFWPAATLSVVLAFVLCFATVHVIPTAVRFGVPPGVADNLPFVGFFAGALAGVAAAFSKAARNAIATAFSLFALGGLTWLFGLLIEGILVAANLDEESVSWVSPAAFGLGVVGGSVGLLAGAFDAVQKLLAGTGSAESVDAADPADRSRSRRAK